jgi:hypothetical protein
MALAQLFATTPAAGHARLRRQPLDRLREGEPSVPITKSKIEPFLPEEKSNHAIFW